jgi:DNA replication and repair protein RecF
LCGRKRFSDGREQQLELRLFRGRKKQITVNGRGSKGSDLSGSLSVVLFCPDDLMLVRDGAAGRRG